MGKFPIVALGLLVAMRADHAMFMQNSYLVCALQSAGKLTPRIRLFHLTPIGILILTPGAGYSNLSWVRRFGPKVDHHPK